MEYLSRILSYVTSTMNFKHHPLCSPMKLNHLMFADDLLLFSKGDITSIMILLRGFATFSAATGLHMNTQKSNIYFNGVTQSVREDILKISGFIEGSIPLKYLGVPISAGKLAVKHYTVLIEKVIHRIRAFGAKKLSYAGRLILVNSVLTSLYSYWAAIFIIPKCVLRKIDSICRNYLWDGSSKYLRTPKVSWEKVCSPKSEGGLGITDSLSWNHAAIGKLVWWIYTKPDSLWVKWVNNIYIKGTPWDQYTPKSDTSWYWGIICKVKEKYSTGYSNGQWLAQPTGYTMSSGYHWIRKKQPQVPWHFYIWNSWCLPKHQFINWFIVREALMLKDKLFSFGISPDSLCLLCGTATETHQHVFQHCQYTQLLLTRLETKMHMNLPQTNILHWIHSKPWSKTRNKVTNALIQALYYAVWLQRNRVRMEHSLVRPEIVLIQVSLAGQLAAGH
ncbi:uncharacterized protein LOC141589961 [Silene latifolia]|uniref:uncharacterized protein LOC141589961 n=1 Tax=Silene latifolia TaxID=37657 RepID=UPI003D77D025